MNKAGFQIIESRPDRASKPWLRRLMRTLFFLLILAVGYWIGNSFDVIK